MSDPRDLAHVAKELEGLRGCLEVAPAEIVEKGWYRAYEERIAELQRELDDALPDRPSGMTVDRVQ